MARETKTVRAVMQQLDSLQALVESYLSDRDIAAMETGCTFAALGSETRRKTPEIRRVARQRTKELAAVIEHQVVDRDGAPERSRRWRPSLVHS